MKISLLDSNQKLSCKRVDGDVVVKIPEKLRAELAKKEAVVIEVTTD